MAALVASVASDVDAAPVPANAFAELRWRNIGPFRGGRTRAVCGVAQQPSVFYIGQVNGGVWKTDDYGRTWRPIFDDQPTQSIGSIAVAPSDPRVIYVGTGEGLHRPDLSVGDGVYKSVDGGATWTHLGLRDGQQIPQLAVDPKNPNRVFAAVLGHPYGPNAERGVFRSVDGGKTWQKTLFKNDSTGASDVAIDPQNPEVVYAALWEERLAPWEDENEYAGTNGGLYKSTDGGATWKQLAGGLPANGVQFDIAIAPSRPSRLYVTLSTSDGSEYGSGKGNGLFRSDDAGATWKQITVDERPMMKIGGGDLMVPVVDPKNPNVLYVASIVAMKSVDGGVTWTWLRGAPGGDDYQNLWVNPNEPNTIALVSDQGAVITVNGGATWSSWFNQSTAQLYHATVSADVPYRVCSGQQESGSACVASRGPDGAITYRDWRPVGASEYGYVAPDPRNADIIYGAGRNQVSRYTWSTGQVQNITPIPVRGAYRVERTQPLIFSTVQPNVLYYAANVLFETQNGGQTWKTISPDLGHPKPGLPPNVGPLSGKDKRAAEHRGAIYAVAPSKKTINTIWAGTDDGKLWITRDRGGAWKDITPPALQPWSKVTQLDASKFDDTTVYASVSRLRVDDLAPYIYRTHDGGATWTAIANGLPAGPVDAVREDPVRKGMLYAATETGVWISFDDGDHWQTLQANLPRSAARDIIVHGDDLIVATHGRGFWIMDDVALLREVTPTLGDTLFKPAIAYRYPRSAYPDTPVPPDEPMAENPPTGAILDYYLASAATTVTLEISDARGAVVRTYASSDAPELTADELAKQLIPAYWVRPHRKLATTAGMHRWVWDLRRPRPLADAYDYPISAVPHDTPRSPEGARVAPGTYTVKLTANGKTYTQKVEVRLDPRIKLAADVAAAQNQLETKLGDLLTRSAEPLLQARSIAEQVGKLAKQPAVKAQVDAFGAKLQLLLRGPKDLAPDAPRPPALARVNGTIASLYRASAIDAAPTAVQLAETAKAERDLAVIAKQWDTFKTTELAQINATLEAAKLPKLRPEMRPHEQGDTGDME